MNFTQNLVAALQGQLAFLGDYKLRIDGQPGPGTSNGVVAAKVRHSLPANDTVTHITLMALFSPDAVHRPALAPIEGEPAWLTEAHDLLGTREVAGPGNNPEIMKWADDLDQWYTGDDVPWCGLFVAHCMAVGAPDEPQDFNRMGARNWLQYGQAADIDNPPLGAVAIKWRTHPTNSWNGHVFIVTGQNATHVRGIGGNQSDNVTETWFPRSSILGVRVPTGYTGQPAPQAVTGSLSTNEA